MSKLTDDEIIQTACDAFYGIIEEESRPEFIRFARMIEKKVKQNIADIAMDNLVAWQQEFENSAQIIGNKPTGYAKLKEDFE